MTNMRYGQNRICWGSLHSEKSLHFRVPKLLKKVELYFCDQINLIIVNQNENSMYTSSEKVDNLVRVFLRWVPDECR